MRDAAGCRSTTGVVRIHVGKAVLAAAALAEIGAAAGALLGAVFLVVWALVRNWPPPPGLLIPAHVLANALLGAAVWGGLVGAPAGAVLLPALGFTVLRRAPLGQVVAYPVVGALAGLVAAALLIVGPAAAGAVPALVPTLAAAGLVAGAAAARGTGRRALPGQPGAGALARSPGGHGRPGM